MGTYAAKTLLDAVLSRRDKAQIPGSELHLVAMEVNSAIQVHDVIPAKAGIHLDISGWTPAFAGVTP